MKTKFQTKCFITKILSFFFILFSGLSLIVQTIPAGENMSLNQKVLLETRKTSDISTNKYFDSS